jgi:hypothetical protein
VFKDGEVEIRVFLASDFALQGFATGFVPLARERCGNLDGMLTTMNDQKRSTKYDAPDIGCYNMKLPCTML